VIDDTTGEAEFTQHFSGGNGGYAFQWASEEGHIHRAGHIRSAVFGDKHEVASWRYEGIAEKLILRFGELSHLDASSILFIEDICWEPPKPNGVAEKWQWMARAKKADKYLKETWGSQFVIETRRHFTERMSGEQIVALIYHELRHIGRDGEILHHEIEDWECMVATLGAHWDDPKASIADILGYDFDGWEPLRNGGRQLTVFEAGAGAVAALRAVK